jgi:cytochrome d ubiquinol oxidase subunit I
MLRGSFTAEARIMLRMGLYFAAVLIPVQLIFGHFNGEYVVRYQPSKMAAIEARWHDEKPASEVLLAWPDVAQRRNLFAITLPAPFGSLIDSDSLDAAEVGLDSIQQRDWPPVAIPFFAFRIMVGCGIAMLALAWLGSYLSAKGRLDQNRILLWLTFFSFPLPFVATLTGWFTAEVGRQPWTVYGVLRTADAMTPFLTTRAATISLVVFCAVYVFIFAFGTLYIYRLLRAGPVGPLVLPPAVAVPNRPMSLAGQRPVPVPGHPIAGE